MSPAAPSIADVSPAPGIVFAIFSPPPGPVSGLVDVGATYAGGPVTSLQLYVDGVQVGDMRKVASNKWAQTVDTARWEDGAHRVSVEALGGAGQRLAVVSRDLWFRNVDRLGLLALAVAHGAVGYEAHLCADILRARPGVERFVCDDRLDGGELETMKVTLTYEAIAPGGVPIVKLDVRRPSGQPLAPGKHHLTFTLNDRHGTGCGWAHRSIRVDAPPVED